jgi:hypothetical protein
MNPELIPEISDHRVSVIRDASMFRAFRSQELALE